jgi:hypothetical protein
VKAPEQRPKGELPLPSPRSPDGLDQRILAYARDNAPRSRPLLRPAWMTGAATACVLVVALLVGGPQQQAPLESEARKSEAVGEAPLPATPAAAPTAQRAGGAQLEATAPAASARAAHKLAGDRDTRNYSELSQAAADAGLQDLPAAQEEAADMPSDPQPVGEPQWLAARIHEIALQLENGNQQAARDAYRALRQQCPDCQLPETLEEALAAYPKY